MIDLIKRCWGLSCYLRIGSEAMLNTSDEKLRTDLLRRLVAQSLSGRLKIDWDTLCLPQFPNEWRLKLEVRWPHQCKHHLRTHQTNRRPRSPWEIASSITATWKCGKPISGFHCLVQGKVGGTDQQEYLLQGIPTMVALLEVSQKNKSCDMQDMCGNQIPDPCSHSNLENSEWFNFFLETSDPGDHLYFLPRGEIGLTGASIHIRDEPRISKHMHENATCFFNTTRCSSVTVRSTGCQENTHVPIRGSWPWSSTPMTKRSCRCQSGHKIELQRRACTRSWDEAWVVFRGLSSWLFYMFLFHQIWDNVFSIPKILWCQEHIWPSQPSLRMGMAASCICQVKPWLRDQTGTGSVHLECIYFTESSVWARSCHVLILWNTLVRFPSSLSAPYPLLGNEITGWSLYTLHCIFKTLSLWASWL